MDTNNSELYDIREVRREQIRANEKAIEAIHKLGKEHQENIHQMAVHYQPELLSNSTNGGPPKLNLKPETLGEALRKAFDYYLDTVKERDYPYTLCFGEDASKDENIVFFGNGTSGL